MQRAVGGDFSDPYASCHSMVLMGWPLVKERLADMYAAKAREVTNSRTLIAQNQDSMR